MAIIRKCRSVLVDLLGEPRRTVLNWEFSSLGSKLVARDLTEGSISFHSHGKKRGTFHHRIPTHPDDL